MDPVLLNVMSVMSMPEPDVFLVDILFERDGEEMSGPFGLRPEDTGPMATSIRQWIAANQMQAMPYQPPASTAYRIAKTTPWMRMTDDEAATMDAVMSETTARLKQIYMAASYLSSDDPLWGMLHQMLADRFGVSRADELLAAET